MSIFSGLFKSRDKPVNRTPGSSFAFYMGGSSSGKIVNERSAMQMTTVYACVRILSEAIAGLPLHLYRYKEDGGKEKATGHPLYLLLHDEPNPEMSSFVFRETLMTHLLLYGNAYAQIIRNGKGEVVGLYPLMANKMSVNRDTNGQLYYQYQRSSDEAHTTNMLPLSKAGAFANTESAGKEDGTDEEQEVASYAQEEARSVSENQKWRVRKNFKEGRPWNCTMLGYRIEDGTFVIEPEEAAIVRRIFSLFLDGMGVQTIANTLNAEGLRTRYGGEFNHSGLQKILRNYAYTGNLLLQKTYRPDCLTKKDYVTYGERPKYHAAETHEPIISPEVFEQVQAELARRADVYGAEYHPANYPFTGLITCAICGKHFIRKHTRTGPTWICGTLKQRGKAACPSKQIPEATLLKLTADMDMSRITGITADKGNRKPRDFALQRGSISCLSFHRWNFRAL